MDAVCSASPTFCRAEPFLICPRPRLVYNAGMSAHPIEKLETQLEALIEGAFARLFRQAISAHDLAILLLRALEDGAAPAAKNGIRAIAPDRYRIELHPDNVNLLLARYPDLSTRLAQLIIDLSEASGYALPRAPQVLLEANRQLTPIAAVINGEHSLLTGCPTKGLEAVDSEQAPSDLGQPTLEVIEGPRVRLAKSIINIGRAIENDIVIADAYISRHHLQLRKRFGAYILIDINSRGGTQVNNIPVSEHRLQHGDVITIGHTSLIYDNSAIQADRGGTTQVMRSDQA